MELAEKSPQSEKPGQKKLSERIKLLEEKAKIKQLTLGEVEEELAEKGATALICFLCLPFLFPIPIPGISTMFGAAIIALTLKIIAGEKAKLPEKWAQKNIPPELFSKIILKSVKIFVWMEKVSKTRLAFFSRGKGKIAGGISMIIAAVALAVPIPPIIPLTNTIPSISIFLIALGMVDEDGLLILFGHFMCIVSWAYFALLAILGTEAYKIIYEWLQKFF
jgi:hypothetical protein